MQNTQFNQRSSSRPVARPATAASHLAPPPPVLSEKQVTLRTLTELKRRIYGRAASAIQQNPDKADIIQKAVDRDASHIAFVINMVTIKL